MPHDDDAPEPPPAAEPTGKPAGKPAVKRAATTARGLRAPRVGRPPTLDRERITAAVMAQDLATLTMQSVAGSLGVAPSALYRWVRNRDELLDLASAEMGRRIVPEREPTAADWREWLTDLAYAIRREFTAFPGFAARMLSVGIHREAGHGPVERAATRAFELAGNPHDRARQCWYAFAAAVMGWIAAEQSGFPADPPMDFAALVDILLRGTTPTRPA
ncbi:TetR/AcrR family transcriptional regulator [Uniformispora flossi]|uniref:TetR/AcrR family transcriptional regulator n=1 Tax=Uniformispora flossi TaxID=3390723 RepID=UPI003C2D2F92